MKRIFPIAAVAAIPVGFMVWGCWPSSVEPIPVDPAVEHQVRQEPEPAGEKTLRELNDLAATPASQTQSKTESDASDRAAGDEMTQLAVLGATPLELEQTGYAELFAGSESSYASYDIDTIVALAESGDKQALLHAVLARSDLPVAQRKLYAIEAAKQGYTSALATLGQMLLMPESATASDRVTGFALLVVSRELDDPVLRVREDGDIWPFMKYHISAKEQERAEIAAHKLMDQMGMEI